MISLIGTQRIPIRTIRDASKASALQEKYPEDFESTIVADIASSDLTEALAGMYGDPIKLDRISH